MQSCNAVYRVACCNRQMCHLDLSVVDDRHLANLLLIARILRLNLQDKTAVDLFDDLVYTRQQSGEQLDRPFFQCLCHDGVVRVSTGLRRYLPCLIPAQVLPHPEGYASALRLLRSDGYRSAGMLPSRRICGYHHGLFLYFSIAACTLAEMKKYCCFRRSSLPA